jgi:pachytene checkpoint protein 2
MSAKDPSSLRHLPNVLTLCTSNLMSAIDQAFLDRVDIKQMIPPPSSAAIYNIFRSCLNELIRSTLVEPPAVKVTTAKKPVTRVSKRTAMPGSNVCSKPSEPSSSPPDTWAVVSAAPQLPTLDEVRLGFVDKPESAGFRVWVLAQKCHGLSGRTLRRLPVLGLAM